MNLRGFLYRPDRYARVLGAPIKGNDRDDEGLGIVPFRSAHSIYDNAR